MDRAATNFREGEAIAFDQIAYCETVDLVYTVEIERSRSKAGGAARRASSLYASPLSIGRRTVGGGSCTATPIRSPLQDRPTR